jgi:aminoglycoside phosphotransferase
VLAGPPINPIAVPDAVEKFIAGRSYETVWLNGFGGLTFRVVDTPRSIYLKWVGVDSGVDLNSEISRLKWASTFTPVPVVIDQGFDDEGTWFATEEIQAENAVSPRWNKEPYTATAAIGTGLRALHDALPLDNCAFLWTVEQRLQNIEEKAVDGGFENHVWSEEFANLTIEHAIAELKNIPELDLVVCHGDACAPNTLIGEDGEWVAHVDFDNLGVADRWADLSIASWSTVWNYGRGWEEKLYESYGSDPNTNKIRYYRLLWELG